MILDDIRKDLSELVVPKKLARFELLYKGWMLIAFVLGWFVFRLLLIVFYVSIILPMGLVFRLIGKDILLLKQWRKGETYWITVTEREKTYLKKF